LILSYYYKLLITHFFVRQHRNFARFKLKCCDELRVLKISGCILFVKPKRHKLYKQSR